MRLTWTEEGLGGLVPSEETWGTEDDAADRAGSLFDALFGYFLVPTECDQLRRLGLGLAIDICLMAFRFRIESL